VLRTGTVTLLFTDLVDSTKSLVALGEDRYDSVRDEHEVLVGGTMAAHHGEVVKSTGDGYMAAFPRAADAVAAAAEIQRLVSRRNEDSEVALGVRIGISAGDVVERAGDYYGVSAVEAARLCAIAAGGQILASETVRSLAGSRGGYDFVALGDLDLKGLPPLATVAVRWGDDAPVFAPSGGAKGNLPASFDRFIGRQHDVDAIRALLGEHRLVTLTGPGGSGKTRLALEVARWIAVEHADGVWLVDLARIDDETLIAEATMGALGLRSGETGASDALPSHLADRDTVLVFDNCEHVLGGAATVITELFAACPPLRVVATSRGPLRVPGEAEYAVEGLGRQEAIELFAARIPGQHRIDDPDAMERICVALEGIPLALELAAAKLRVLSPAELADRLDDQLAVLTHGSRTAPERQRTLRATLDWSYDLLDDDERTMFRFLGIFVGGFTVAAAEQVVAADQIPRARVIDLLGQLVERALLTRVPGGSGTRFRLLEPVRQYAAERLGEAGERNALAQRHLDWVTHFARHAVLEFFVSQGESTVRISEEHPNICQALEFAIGNRDGATAAKIIDALGFPWYTAGQPDGRRWCERVLAVVPPDAPADTRAGALVATAMMLQGARQHDAARRLLLEARELYRNAHNVFGEAWALTWLGRDAASRSPGGAEAQTLFEEALSRYRQTDVPQGAGWCLAELAWVALQAEDFELARRRAEEAEQLARSAHIDQIVGEALRVLVFLDLRAGDFENADRRLAEMLAIQEAAGDRGQLVMAHAQAAEVGASRGDVAGAASHLTASAELARAVKASERALEWLKPLITSAAYVAYMDGRAHDSAVLFGARLGLGPLFVKRFRPILEALEQQGLSDQIAAGSKLSADEALERAVEIVRARPSADLH
jgi:predicted ATPase/class 3 adenylate cyclase